MVCVAYQGEPGAFSEEAALALLGPNIELQPWPTFAALFDALAVDRCDYLVAPVENRLAGKVATVEELWNRFAWRCHAEMRLPIALHLIVLGGERCPRLETLEAAASHPVALAQCRGFFRRHRWIAPCPSDDTAASVRRMVEAGEATQAAIASRRAAARYGAVILREHLEDAPGNWTRFVVLGR